jgi:hypothetical protein
MSITVNVSLPGPPDDGRLIYFAAAPAFRHASYTGSGLPYASAKQAMQSSPNRGLLKNVGTNFTITIPSVPGSFYTGLGTRLVPPTIFIAYKRNNKDISTAIPLNIQALPYRLLTYPSTRNNSLFYDGSKLPVRSQEEVLRSSGYPIDTLTTPTNHWGLKPPM